MTHRKLIFLIVSILFLISWKISNDIIGAYHSINKNSEDWRFLSLYMDSTFFYAEGITNHYMYNHFGYWKLNSNNLYLYYSYDFEKYLDIKYETNEKSDSLIIIIDSLLMKVLPKFRVLTYYSQKYHDIPILSDTILIQKRKQFKGRYSKYLKTYICNLPDDLYFNALKFNMKISHVTAYDKIVITLKNIISSECLKDSLFQNYRVNIDTLVLERDSREPYIRVPNNVANRLIKK